MQTPLTGAVLEVCPAHLSLSLVARVPGTALLQNAHKGPDMCCWMQGEGHHHKARVVGGIQPDHPSADLFKRSGQHRGRHIHSHNDTPFCELKATLMHVHMTSG